MIRKETQKMVKEVENAAREIGQNATAQSNLILSKATVRGLSFFYREEGLSVCGWGHQNFFR